MMNAIERAQQHSEAKLKELRKSIKDVGVSADDVVVTCGSYARREASNESDIDYFIITMQLDTSEHASLVERVETAITKVVPVGPATEGAFANVESRDSMLVNIGGDQDSNQKVTRRMLFLLEGEWLFNPYGMKQVRRQVLERYIGDGMTDHQLALFLLNDIIRYYRTIAVDYEFKTVEGENPKPWGIRNIKLVFSRKLLYASGLFSIGMTADREREQKIKILQDLFGMTVIDRMESICGRAKLEGVLKSYDRFLGRLEDKNVRARLNSLDRGQRHDRIFRDLKNEGHHFTRELLKLFEDTFDTTHPIRRAVIF